MVNFISPYEISEMFHKKFDGLDFAQPYLSGVFEDDPKKGRITIGVRTPWYDFEYFVYSKESFWGCIANVESVEDVIQGAVGHLNAAVAMQLSPDGSKAVKLDIEDIDKYQVDPEGYISESDPAVEHPYNGRDFDVYVHHDSNWSELAMMDAENVIFLCDCDSCISRMKRVREYRGEDILKKAEDSDKATLGRYPYGESDDDETKEITTKLHADGIEYPRTKVVKNDDWLYVDHDNSLGFSDEALIAAKDITFLCTCQPCKKKFYEIRGIRIKNQREK